MIALEVNWDLIPVRNTAKDGLTLPRNSGQILGQFVRRQNLVDLKLPELRETLAHQVVLMLITVMHLLAERQGL